MKPSIKTITIRKILGFGFVFLVSMLLVIGFSFYSLINETMRDKGLSLAKSIETTLTSHMLSSTFEQKQELIALAGQLPGIRDLRVIRSTTLNRQFGLEDQTDLLADPNIQQVMQSGTESIRLPLPGDANGLIRISYPYIATSTGESAACTHCHQVSPGDVLAVLDFNVDTSDYQVASRLYLLVLFTLFVAGLVVVGRLLVFILDRNVRAPLEWLVDRTQKSYLHHETIDTQHIESMELDEFALRVNAFNELVMLRNQELQAANDEIQSTQREIILTMGAIGETRSRETANHVVRVAEISKLLGERYGLSEQEITELHDASPMHDIGKVGIPDSILQKPGKLTDDEYATMQTHSEKGYEIFRHSERPLLKAASIIAHEHHERWDGKGYPRGISGNQIHIFGRIVAIADVFDALLSRRCYKDPWPAEKVYEYFKEASGTQFDPELVELVLENFEEMQAVLAKFND